MAVVALYARAVENDFVNYDDPSYVYENPIVNRGFSLEAVRLAFTTAHSANWHPLTWLSHAVDWQLYGERPAGHHATNVALHAINAALLYMLLIRMTGARGPAWLTAAVFAVHPLRVESVAWISERKDVLSALFFLLTLLAYQRYAKSKSTSNYAAALLCFSFGLLSKPMLVTTPCVLLLLDFWPLGRMVRSRAASLVIEKLPFFALSLASCIVTYRVQRSFAAVVTEEVYSLPVRLANAAAAYSFYLVKTALPTRLAVIYPHPGGNIPPAIVLGSASILGVTSALAALLHRRAPYLIVGWLWFLGMLVPVIGFVQVGNQAYADRYSYLPQIGLLIALCWGTRDIVARRPALGPILKVAAGAAIIALSIATFVQIGYWRDSIRLFRHAVEVTGFNRIALSNLGLAQLMAGQPSDAERSFREILETLPGEPDALNNLSTALIRQGKFADAESACLHVLAKDPDDINALNNRGAILVMQQRPGEAVSLFERLSQRAPDDPEVLLNWAIALAQLGRPDEAIHKAKTAIAIKPGFEEARKFIETLDCANNTGPR